MMVGIIGTVVSIVGVDMIPFPDKKYNIIYADPAWSYKVWSKKGQGRSAEHHYSTMNIDDIKNLPIQDIADDNCILFMWVTFPLLKDSFNVIESWGFTYKTVGFTWVKKNKKTDSWFWGMGHWTRANAELCLIATKGTIKRQSASVHQVIDTPIERHSKKPDIVRDKIVELVGDLPRIELFARETAEGWDSWGNEIG
jgi:N6-adenosine-specific RNA methylase IME4